MSYIYHGKNKLIKLPNRTVQTFETGMARIDVSYACRTGAESLHRSTLAEGNVLPNDDGAPCIDGAYIFPKPQENVRGDGFTEFRCSAFGRMSPPDDSGTTLGQISKSIELGSHVWTATNIDITGAASTSTLARSCLMEVATFRVVVPAGGLPDLTFPGFDLGVYVSELLMFETNFSEKISKPLETLEEYYSRLLNQPIGTVTSVFTNTFQRSTLFVNKQILMQNVDSTNFGRFDEYTFRFYPRVSAGVEYKVLPL